MRNCIDMRVHAEVVSKLKKTIIDFVGLNSVSEPAMKLLFALMDSGLPKRKSKFIVYFVLK